MLKTDIVAGVCRAADWLIENRANHIVGSLATDKYGFGVPPASPEATCFCMVGRIAKELNIPGGVGVYGRVDELLREAEIKIDTHRIFTTNDQGTRRGNIRAPRLVKEKASCTSSS